VEKLVVREKMLESGITREALSSNYKAVTDQKVLLNSLGKGNAMKKGRNGERPLKDEQGSSSIVFEEKVQGVNLSLD